MVIKGSNQLVSFKIIFLMTNPGKWRNPSLFNCLKTQHYTEHDKGEKYAQ